MRIVLDRREEVAAWVGERLDMARFSPEFQAVGYEVEGELRGGHIFEALTEHDARIHIAGSAAVSRKACRLAWAYIFVQCRCKRLTATVRASNRRMRRIIERIGFREEGRMRSFFGTEDAILYGLLRDEAPAWMRI